MLQMVSHQIFKPTRQDSAKNKKKTDKNIINDLNYSGIKFPVTTKQYNKIEKQNDIHINVFGYETNNHTPFTFQKKRMKIVLIYY